MPLFKRRQPVPEGPGIQGPTRLLRDVTDLAGVHAGDIVVIEVEDLDADRAQALVDRAVAAVINVTSTVTGRFPAQGARVLVSHDIVLVDEVGEAMWGLVRQGEVLRVHEGVVHLPSGADVTGLAVTADRVAERQAQASSGLSNQLDAVVTNATDILRRDRAMLVDGEKIPRVHQRVKHRPVVLVDATEKAPAELRNLRRFVHDHDPLLVGVGAGADLLLRHGLGLDLAVSAADDLSDRAIQAADEIVICAPTGALLRPERYEKHGRQPVIFTATGGAADLALILLDDHDPSLIVLVGWPTNLDDVVDRDPVTVAGTFIARLRASSRVIDADAIDYFTRQRISMLAPTLLLIAGVIAVLVALATTSVGRDWLDPIIDPLTSLVDSIQGLFS